jgi:hypothetical protein
MAIGRPVPFQMIRDGNIHAFTPVMHVGDRTVALNSNQIKNKKAGAYADGGGLCLHVRNSGERVWAFRFTAPDGKRARMEFAKVGDKDGQLGLSEARDQARAIASR